MNPAFSVILFTTLSGAGYGLWIWSALAALVSARSESLPTAMIAGFVLVAVGLSSSLGHLGKPQRAWRAFSQWRTSWLSREGVFALATFVPAIALGALLWRGDTGGAAVVASALLLVAGSLATVACTAMIYASLPPIPAWRHPAVLPIYLMFSLQLGGLLIGAIASDAIAPLRGLVPIATLALGALLAIFKLRYWRAIDRDAGLPTRGAAVGLPDRDVTVFERPNTEANYLTREMGFVLARRHARKLRLAALLLIGAVPTVCLLAILLFFPASPAIGYGCAATSALFGAAVERWLFFAQARHVVSVYYGLGPRA